MHYMDAFHLRMRPHIAPPHPNAQPQLDAPTKKLCKHLIDPWIKIFESFLFYVLSRVLMLVTQVSITYDK